MRKQYTQVKRAWKCIQATTSLPILKPNQLVAHAQPGHTLTKSACRSCSLQIHRLNPSSGVSSTWNAQFIVQVYRIGQQKILHI
jgi:hypothetical protein